MGRCMKTNERLTLASRNSPKRSISQRCCSEPSRPEALSRKMKPVPSTMKAVGALPSLAWKALAWSRVPRRV
ncbi:hypothetical protein D3C72_2337650 [compost metagenome]